jgi:hypothetical protein
VISLNLAMLLAAIIGAVPAPLTLALVALVPLGWIGAELHLDDRRTWTQETDSTAWHGADIDELPHPRQSLLPVRQSPTDLPDRWDTAGLAAVELGSRARHASTVVAQTAMDYRPLHLRTVGEVTEEFERIVGVEFGAQRCDSCTVGRDGEQQHVSCNGCSCPCTVVAPAEEYAVAGGTR